MENMSTSNVTMNNVRIGDLQKILDGFPRVLNHDYKINLKPGERYENTLVIKGFSGSGRLSIIGSEITDWKKATFANFSHAERIQITGNTLRMIHVQGFFLDGQEAGTPKQEAVLVYQNTGYTWVYMISHQDGGIHSGYYSNENSGITYFSNCEACYADNYAFRCGMGNMVVNAPAGVGNKVVYRAENGGTIKIRSAGTIKGTTVYSKASAGTIVDPSGAFK